MYNMQFCSVKVEVLLESYKMMKKPLFHNILHTAVSWTLKCWEVCCLHFQLLKSKQMRIAQLITETKILSNNQYEIQSSW